MPEVNAFGFMPSEVHYIVPDNGCCPFIRTVWYEDDGYFSLDTGARLDVSLNGVGLRNSDLPQVRESSGFAVHRADEFTLLGRLRPAGEITVFPSSDQGTVFGTVGVLFFDGAVLAYDPAGPHVAVAHRDWLFPGEKEPFERLPHVGSSGLPITREVRLAQVPEMSPATLLSTGTARSYVSRRFADALPAKVIDRHGIMEIALPTAGALAITVDLVDEAPRYAVPLAVDEVELVLGMDVLRNFVSIFDFRNGVTLLEPYRGAI